MNRVTYAFINTPITNKSLHRINYLNNLRSAIEAIQIIIRHH
jgi:hypothetical protein